MAGGLRTISVIITANTGGLTSQLARSAAAVQAFGGEASRAGAGAGQLGLSVEEAAVRARNLEAAAAAAAANAQRLGAASTQAAAGARETGAALKAAETNAAAYGTQAAAAARKSAAATDEAAAAARRHTEALAQYGPASAATARLGQESEQAAAKAARLAESETMAAARAQAAAAQVAPLADAHRVQSASASAAAAAEQQAANEARLAGAAAAAAGRDAEAAAASTARMGTAGTAAGTALRTGAVVGAVAFGVALVAAAASAVQFEASMHNVASLDADVRANFKQTEQAVLDMSKTLPQSANTLAKGLYDIASSGFYGADAMSILKTSAVAASAGLTTTDVATKAIVASLNAYGLGANSATRISDALFSTVNYGVISFEALTGAIAHSVGNAAKAGVNIEQLGAALATMTLSGMSASEAGVSLNNLLSKLIKPSAALGETVKALGINLTQDLKDPAIGLYGVMEKLRETSQGNLAVLLSWFPEIRAARGALSLMSADGETYARVVGNMGDQQKTAGATMAVLAEQAKGALFQLKELGNQIAATGIELGLKLIPYITSGTQGLAQLGAAVKDGAKSLATEFAPAIQQLKAGFADIGQSVQNLGAIVGALWNAFVPVVDLPVKLGLGAAVTGFHGLGAAISETTGFLAAHERIVYAVVAAYAAWNLNAVVTGIRALMAAASMDGLMLLYGVFIRLNQAMAIVQARLTVFGTSWAAMGAAAGVYGLAIGGVAVALDSLANDADRAKQKVAALTTNVDTNNLQSLKDAITRLADEYNRLGGQAGVAFQNIGKPQEQHAAGAEADALRAKIEQLTAQYNALAEKQSKIQANTQALANGFGLTADQVTQLAQKAGVDLSTSLNKVDASGLTVAQRFRDVAASMVGANASGTQISAALQALGTAAGGADQAVKDLKLTLDVFVGKGLSAAQAADGFTTAINKLASGTTISTTALVGNSDAAIKNRAAIFDAIGAAEDDAIAQTNLTGSTSAGTAAFEAHKTAIINAATAAGLDKTQVENLINSLNLIPPDVHSTVSVPGADTSTAKVNALRAALANIPANTTARINVERDYYSASSPGSPGNAFYATGGQISGPGTGTSDSVPIMASAGEWVISASSAAQYGGAAMAAVNAGQAAIIPRMAAGGPVGRYASGGSIAGGGGGTSSAVQLIASGASTLAEVYQATAGGADATARALGDMVTRMSAADQRTNRLADATGTADRVMARWRDTLISAAARTNLAALANQLMAKKTAVNTLANQTNTTGLQALGGQLNLMNTGIHPVTLAATQNQTVAQQDNTLGNETNRQGLLLLGTQMDGMTGVQYPAVLLGTQTQTTAQGENTDANATNLLGLTDLGVQLDQASGVQLPTLTTATDLQTTATQLGTTATDLQTTSTTEMSAATDVATTSTTAQTAATTTATGVSTTFSGELVVQTGSLNTTAAAATTAAANVNAYAAALAAVPANVTTTITTNYVTVGAPAAGAGFAGGGRVGGPGGPTDDRIPIMVSAGEWVIRAAAAQAQGDRAMAALNAGRARIVPYAAGAYAGGGLVAAQRGYASGGRVAGVRSPAGGTVMVNAPITLQVLGSADPAATATAVEAKLGGVIRQLTAAVRSGAGRGQS